MELPSEASPDGFPSFYDSKRPVSRPPSSRDYAFLLSDCRKTRRAFVNFGGFASIHRLPPTRPVRCRKEHREPDLFLLLLQWFSTEKGSFGLKFRIYYKYCRRLPRSRLRSDVGRKCLVRKIRQASRFPRPQPNCGKRSSTFLDRSLPELPFRRRLRTERLRARK